MDRKLSVGRCVRILQHAIITIITLGGVEASAATAAVSPSAVSNFFEGAITLDIGGLTNGEAVVVERVLDVNINGAVNAVDVRMQTVTLVDGQAAVIGGVTNLNQPCDLNPAAGAIRAEFAFRAMELGRLVGRHIFRVSSPSGRFNPVTTVLRVTNAAFSQSLVGRVRSSGTNVPYGMVALLRNDGEGGLFAGAVAASNGLFTIKAPAGAYRLVAVKRGYVADFLNAPTIGLGDGTAISNNAVLLPAPRSISGRIVDAANTNIGLPGVQVFVGSSNSLFAFAFTDASGVFNVPVTANIWEIEADHRSLGQIGYVGLEDDTFVSTTSGNVSGVVIAVPRATSLIYGQLRTPGDAPIANIEIFGAHDNVLSARSESDWAGRYALGVTGGQWHVELNARSLSEAGYLGMGTSTNVGIEDGQALEVGFVARPFTSWISGVVVDETGNPVPQTQLVLSDFSGGYSSGLTDENGHFNLGVAAGTWHLELQADDDEPSLFVYPEVSFGVEDGITLSNVEYRVFRATNRIEGMVVDQLSNAVPDVELYAWTDIGGVIHRASSGATQFDGSYVMNVSTGLWHVGIECFRIEQRAYTCPPLADVTLSNTTARVDFTLVPRLPDPPVLNQPARLENGQFRFELDGPGGWQYQVQVSDDLINWTPLDTDVLNPPVDVIDPNANGARRFYRVVRNAQ